LSEQSTEAAVIDRGLRKIRVGQVVGDAMDKTVVVSVQGKGWA